MISLLKGEGEIYVFIKEEKAKGFKLIKETASPDRDKAVLTSKMQIKGCLDTSILRG